MIDHESVALTAKHREAEITFLRLVPGTSPVHRLWAGTKLIAVAIISIVASLRPTWVTLIAVATLVFAGFVIGRVPPSALPRAPRSHLRHLRRGES